MIYCGFKGPIRMVQLQIEGRLGDQSFLWNQEYPDYERITRLVRDALISEYSSEKEKMDLRIRVRFPTKENSDV